MIRDLVWKTEETRCLLPNRVAKSYSRLKSAIKDCKWYSNNLLQAIFSIMSLVTFSFRSTWTSSVCVVVDVCEQVIASVCVLAHLVVEASDLAAITESSFLFRGGRELLRGWWDLAFRFLPLHLEQLWFSVNITPHLEQRLVSSKVGIDDGVTFTGYDIFVFAFGCPATWTLSGSNAIRMHWDTGCTCCLLKRSRCTSCAVPLGAAYTIYVARGVRWYSLDSRWITSR